MPFEKSRQAIRTALIGHIITDVMWDDPAEGMTLTLAEQSAMPLIGVGRKRVTLGPLTGAPTSLPEKYEGPLSVGMQFVISREAVRIIHICYYSGMQYVLFAPVGDDRTASTRMLRAGEFRELAHVKYHSPVDPPSPIPQHVEDLPQFDALIKTFADFWTVEHGRVAAAVGELIWMWTKIQHERENPPAANSPAPSPNATRT
jgi:hypothetical protein